MIDQYGSIHELPDAACQPHKDQEYRIIFRISRLPKQMSDPSPGFLHLALTINLFEWAGVPRENLHLAGVIHGDATPAALSPEVYGRKFSRVNPDADLIHQLTHHDVKIYVCGQSILDRGYRQDDVNPEVIFALSALSVLPAYQLKGYALMHY
jgi:intracellular sulfur oxidation DsrE/DsrF family protein